MFDMSLLQYGDLLVYSGGNPLSWAIKVKTWSSASHVEIYTADNVSIGANKGGLKGRRFEEKHLYAVLRPAQPVDLQKAYAYWKTVEGQGYDTFGLLAFFRLGSGAKNKQICSEFCTNFYRAGGFDPFGPHCPSYNVSPSMFLTNNDFTWVWSKKEDKQ